MAGEIDIAGALRRAKVAELAKLLPRVQAAAEAARQTDEAKRSEALDPLTPAREVARLRAEAADAAFEAERMVRAADAVSEALVAAREAEARRQTRDRYEAARGRRDAVVQRVRAEYPDLAARLVDLLRELVAASADVQAANRDLPEGAERLELPEVLAREGLPHMQCAGGIGDPMLLAEMAVPDLDDPHRMLWPPTGFNTWLQRPLLSDIIRALPRIETAKEAEHAD